jgi:hypothetical protein
MGIGSEVKAINDEVQCEDILVTAPDRMPFYERCMVYFEDPTSSTKKMMETTSTGCVTFDKIDDVEKGLADEGVVLQGS